MLIKSDDRKKHNININKYKYIEIVWNTQLKTIYHLPISNTPDITNLSAFFPSVFRSLSLSLSLYLYSSPSHSPILDSPFSSPFSHLTKQIDFSNQTEIKDKKNLLEQFLHNRRIGASNLGVGRGAF